MFHGTFLPTVWYDNSGSEHFFGFDIIETIGADVKLIAPDKENLSYYGMPLGS